MTNIILISGLAGSGKTYLADMIKDKLKNLFDVRYFGVTQENYQHYVELANEDDLLVLEMHPPFDKIDLKDHNLLHVVISKDWSVYNQDLSKEKKKFIDDFFDKNPKRERWNTDIIKYNKTRFAHMSHANKTGNVILTNNLEQAFENIKGWTMDIRFKELFLFANENYDYMLYHSPMLQGETIYEGTAPTMDKFLSLNLESFIGTDKKENTCLDIGCNIGAVTQLLNQLHFKEVFAIDVLTENITCAKWMQKKFYRNSNIHYEYHDFMKLNQKFDYIFALAVLHHIALKHPFVEVIKHLAEITNIATVIEINEMPNFGLTMEKIKTILKRYFKEVKVIGNAYLPVQKTLAKNRWIIHCKK